jgi:undecaprenyl phosphate N,N'-diacetylbacillosamine 1-phosphate transferase
MKDWIHSKAKIYSKRIFDVSFSIVLIILLSPVYILVAIAVKISSRGPILFSQKRLGQYGKEFYILKFRTMVANAENIGTGIFSYAGDTRITKIGSILRGTSLDEIPQLFNIFAGSMSFVGPRPPITYELGNYSEFNNTLKKRFIVKPGVTGYAQINGRNELSWDEKISNDLKYIDDYSKEGLFLDAKIIIKTIYKILLREGTHEIEENYESDKKWTEKAGGKKG